MLSFCTVKSLTPSHKYPGSKMARSSRWPMASTSNPMGTWGGLWSNLLMHATLEFIHVKLQGMSSNSMWMLQVKDICSTNSSSTSCIPAADVHSFLLLFFQVLLLNSVKSQRRSSIRAAWSWTLWCCSATSPERMLKSSGKEKRTFKPLPKSRT